MWRELQRLSERALRCARCGARACSERECACGAPPPLAQIACPFARLALTPRWGITTEELRVAWLGRVRMLHAFFARERQLALHSERALAAVHEAYEQLRAPLDHIQLLFGLFLDIQRIESPCARSLEPPWAGLSSHERTKLWVESSQRQEYLSDALRALWEQLTSRALTSSEALPRYHRLFDEFRLLEALRSGLLEKSW